MCALCVYVRPLHLLVSASQAGTLLNRLVVDDVQLQSDQHANTHWPWEELQVLGDMNVAMFAKLPGPASAGVRRNLQCKTLYMDSSILEVRA